MSYTEDIHRASWFVLFNLDGSGGSSAAGRSTPDLDKPRKKRGRPKKGTESQDDSTGGPTRPKRGRPPKKKVQEPEAGSSEEDSATEENDTETGKLLAQHLGIIR